MKFIYRFQLTINLKVLFNRLGYHQQRSKYSGEYCFVRRIGGAPYPRFHLFIKQLPEGWLFNLHLDEKRPSYQGQVAHSGQYDSGLVSSELDRIKNYINNS